MTRMQCATDPKSSRQSREGKANGYNYGEHRTVDSKGNVAVNMHVDRPTSTT